MEQPQNAEALTAYQLFGPDAPPPNTTREKLIVTAYNLVREIGFHAVGLDRIIAQVGVTKTTFYNHFESKDDLLVEVIRLRDKIEGKTFLDRVGVLAAENGQPTLLVMFDVLDEWLNDPDYHGCLFIHACAEFPAAHDPVHQVAARHYAVSRDLVRDVAAQEGYEDPEDLADELVLLLQGALTYRLISSDNEAARIARRGAERALVAHGSVK